MEYSSSRNIKHHDLQILLYLMKRGEAINASMISDGIGKNTGKKPEHKTITSRLNVLSQTGFVNKKSESSYLGKKFYDITTVKPDSERLILEVFDAMKNRKELVGNWPNVAYQMIATQWFRNLIDTKWVSDFLDRKNLDLDHWPEQIKHLEFDRALYLCIHSSPSALLRLLKIEPFSKSHAYSDLSRMTYGKPDESTAKGKDLDWFTVFKFLGNSEELNNYFHSMIFDIITDLHLNRKTQVSPFSRDNAPVIDAVNISWSPKPLNAGDSNSLLQITPISGRTLHLETSTSYSTSLFREKSSFWFDDDFVEDRSKKELFGY